MMDYRLLEALAMVSREQGFEKAAAKLFITQSAVSQRIRQLEEMSGQILVTRTIPPKLTHAGKRYVMHFSKVKELEEDLVSEEENDQEFTGISIGINVDSLSSWFLPVIIPYLRKHNVLLELKVDDQEHTYELLKNGEVSGCISASSRTVQGCTVHPIGSMEYCMACTESFRRKWFSGGFVYEAVKNAPAVIFNRKDNLHNEYLQAVLIKKPDDIPTHYIPSSDKYVKLILEDLAYGVVPRMQFNDLFKKGLLNELVKQRFSVNLYWHHWNIKSHKLEALNRLILDFTENGKLH